MKVLGILSIALVAAVGTAVQQLGSGAGLWAALLGYLAVGFTVTLLGAAVVILRALDAVRPFPKPVSSPIVTGSPK